MWVSRICKTNDFFFFPPSQKQVKFRRVRQCGPLLLTFLFICSHRSGPMWASEGQLTWIYRKEGTSTLCECAWVIEAHHFVARHQHCCPEMYKKRHRKWPAGVERQSLNGEHLPHQTAAACCEGGRHHVHTTRMSLHFFTDVPCCSPSSALHQLCGTFFQTDPST